LGFIRNHVLLPYKEVSYAGDGEKHKSENSYRRSPASYVAMGLIGIALLAAGWSIYHFIYSSKRLAWVVGIAGILLSAALLWIGLFLISPPS